MFGILDRVTLPLPRPAPTNYRTRRRKRPQTYNIQDEKWHKHVELRRRVLMLRVDELLVWPNNISRSSAKMVCADYFPRRFRNFVWRDKLYIIRTE